MSSTRDKLSSPLMPSPSSIGPFPHHPDSFIPAPTPTAPRIPCIPLPNKNIDKHLYPTSFAALSTGTPPSSSTPSRQSRMGVNASTKPGIPPNAPLIRCIPLPKI
ncbi:hypothetical protein M422DRAFT_30293 [Sphaerobolus stellatus SS14]|uniref:Uncharacterized protein n=1 Tax=Sphaerobolus stellatus (strain SS14) TaxID=990650 RepID=A0A0C9VZQ3_SPHS4|nr:hypothetical protein M422DRAFT_30293 [Sphaerobolus stellatus SS14]